MHDYKPTYPTPHGIFPLNAFYSWLFCSPTFYQTQKHLLCGPFHTTSASFSAWPHCILWGVSEELYLYYKPYDTVVLAWKKRKKKKRNKLLNVIKMLSVAVTPTLVWQKMSRHKEEDVVGNCVTKILCARAHTQVMWFSLNDN